MRILLLIFPQPGAIKPEIPTSLSEPEINKYEGTMLMQREKNSGQNHDRNSLKLWQNSNLWERFLRNQNCMHEETKSRLN